MELPHRIGLTALLVAVVFTVFVLLTWWFRGEPPSGSLYEQFLTSLVVVAFLALAVAFTLGVVIALQSIWA